MEPQVYKTPKIYYLEADLQWMLAESPVSGEDNLIDDVYIDDWTV